MIKIFFIGGVIIYSLTAYSATENLNVCECASAFQAGYSKNTVKEVENFYRAFDFLKGFTCVSDKLIHETEVGAIIYSSGSYLKFKNGESLNCNLVQDPNNELLHANLRMNAIKYYGVLKSYDRKIKSGEKIEIDLGKEKLVLNEKDVLYGMKALEEKCSTYLGKSSRKSYLQLKTSTK